MATTTLLLDGEVLVAGSGREDRGAEVYAPATATFALTGHMIAPRQGHAAIRLPGGKVLLLSSQTPGAPSAELFEP
jgi:hypothetical protein